MEKEIRINIPEGYDDVVFDNETKTVKFIKKEKEYIKSWKDYCDKYHYVHERVGSWAVRVEYVADNALDVMTGRDRAQMEIFARLRLIYFDWVQGWKPDGKRGFAAIYYNLPKGFETANGFVNVTRPFMFPTEEMAKKFLETFKDMLEDVKELI